MQSEQELTTGAPCIDEQSKPPRSEALEQSIDMFSGIVAGAIAKALEYPFDTIKVLCQIQPQRSFSTLQLAKNVLFNEGIFRIYRGLSAPLFGSCLEYFTTFWMYGMAERYIKLKTGKEELSMLEVGCCGAFSGLGIGTVLTPVEFVKAQMQNPITAKHYKSTLHCFKYHLRTNPMNLTTGFQASLLFQTPGTFVYFYAYKGSLRVFKHLTDTPASEDPSNWMILVSGGIAGVAFWGTFYPIDLIKNKLQAHEQCIAGETTEIAKLNHSVPRLLVMRVRQYGFASLFNGYSVVIPQAIVSCSCVFFVYEYCRKAINNFI